MATIFIQTTDTGLEEIKRDLRVSQKEYDYAFSHPNKEDNPPHVWAILRSRNLLGIMNNEKDVIRPE